MSKKKHSKSHQQQLCSGKMEYTEVQGAFGPVQGFRCSSCGIFLRGGAKKALHHVAEKEKTA